MFSFEHHKKGMGSFHFCFFAAFKQWIFSYFKMVCQVWRQHWNHPIFKCQMSNWIMVCQIWRQHWNLPRVHRWLQHSYSPHHRQIFPGACQYLLIKVLNLECLMSILHPHLHHVIIAKHHHDKGRVTFPNRINFRKSSGRGGVISNPKIYIAQFGPLNMAFPAWK